MFVYLFNNMELVINRVLVDFILIYTLIFYHSR